MKKIFFLFILTILFSKAFSQNTPAFNKLEVELDPVAFILNGYSAHVIFNHDHFRFDAGIFNIEEPASLSGNKGFTTKSGGFGFKVNYLLKQENSLYTGLDVEQGPTHVTFNNTGEKDTGHSLSIGGHVGYRIFLFPKTEGFTKGLYLSPWAGIGYNYIYDKVKLAGYDNGKFAYFATVHFGYRF